jgi:hypothetical protein
MIVRDENGKHWPSYALLGLAGLALAASGVHFGFFSRPLLDLPVTIAWIVLIGAAFDESGQPGGLLAGLGAIAGLAFLTLALLHGQPLAAWLAAGSLAACTVWLVGVRAGRRAVAIAARWALGFGLAASSIALSFPGRPPLSTALIPVVVLGLPLGILTLQIARRGLAGSPAEASNSPLAAWQREQAWSHRQATGLLWTGGLLLGGSAVAMSLLDTFPSNMVALLTGAGCLAMLRARSLLRLGLVPLVIYGLGVATLLAFVFSLKYHFLDFIFVGTYSGYQGWDFFQMPCAASDLLHGLSPYLLHEAGCEYAPWAARFYLHPLAAILPGGLLYALRPWLAYTLFVAFSIGVVLGLYWLFARLAPDLLRRSLIFLCLAASWPLYLMLWMGQAQIFVLLSFGLMAAALFAQREGWSRRASVLLASGLLVGLLTKPLMAPIALMLIVARETRKATVTALVAYGLLSLVLLVAPGLNPEAKPLSVLLDGTETPREFGRDNGNLVHWSHMWRANPGRERGGDREVMSLIEIVALDQKGSPIIGAWLRVGAGLSLLVQVWAVGSSRTSAARLRQLRLASVLVAGFYVVFYSQVFEYHFATLALAPVVLLLILPDTRDRQARAYLLLGLVAYIPFLLPSIFPLVVPNATREAYYDPAYESFAQMVIYRSYRALPALALFVATLLAMLRLRWLDMTVPNSAAAGTASTPEVQETIAAG